MLVCEKCGELHNGLFGSGRFCNRKCANSRNWNDADKKRKSISAKNSEKVKLANSFKKFKKVEKIQFSCKLCGKQFLMLLGIAKKRKFCSLSCAAIFNKIGGYKKVPV